MDELSGPVPADPPPSPDARCRPPSDCWAEWERQVNARVEAVAKLARMERGVQRARLSSVTAERDALRAELAAATARFAAEQAAYVEWRRSAAETIAVLATQNGELRAALRDAGLSWRVPADDDRSAALDLIADPHVAQLERALVEAREERDELREGQPLPVRALLRQVSRLQEENERLRADVERLRGATADAVGSWVDAREENERQRVENRRLREDAWARKVGPAWLHESNEMCEGTERELTKLRAELADLRRQAADELSREGQEMALDEVRGPTYGAPETGRDA